MIGVALVVFVAIFAAGLRATIDEGIDKQVRAAGIVTHQDGFSPLPDGVVDELAQGRRRQRPSRRSASRPGKLVSDDKNLGVTGIDPATVARRAVAQVVGRLRRRAVAASAPSQAIVSQDFADSHNLKVGDSISMLTPRGKQVTYESPASTTRSVGMIGDVTVTNASLESDWESKDVAFALVGLATRRRRRGAQAAPRTRR